MKKRIIKSEEGSALVLAMMVFLVLSVLGAMLGMVTIGSLNLGTANQDLNSAYYIAQAGANMAYEEIKAEVDKAYKDTKTTNSEGVFFQKVNASKIVETGKKNKSIIYGEGYFNSQSNSQPTAEVRVVEQGKSTEDDNEYKYIIQSTGKVDGKTRTVEKPIQVSWKSHVTGEGLVPLWWTDVAITFKELLNIRAWTNIKGNIVNAGNGTVIENGVNHATNSLILRLLILLFGIRFDNKDIDWKIFDIVLERFPTQIPEYSGTPEINKGYFKVNSNTKTSELNINTSNKLVVETQGETVNLVVDSLVLSGLNTIVIEGTGTLNIIVKNSLKMVNFRNLNTSKSSKQLNILYAGGEQVEISGLTELRGSLFVNEADLRIIGHTTITNGIISGGKEVHLYGDNTVTGMIYAPNAHVRLGTQSIIGSIFLNTNVNGIILANRLTLLGQSKVTYDRTLVEDFHYPSANVEREPTIEDLISAEPALEQ